MSKLGVLSHLETNDSYPKLCLQLLQEINKLRDSPINYIEKLRNIQEKVYKNTLDELLSEDEKEGMQRLNKSYTQTILLLSEKNLPPMHRLHASYGLSKAATDVICELGTLALVAPVSVPDSLESNQDEDSIEYSVAKKHIAKYGTPGTFLYENFAYSSGNPCNILVQVLRDGNEMITGGKDNLLSPALRIVGLAIGPHKSLTHCACILTANSFFENPSFSKSTGVLDKKESKAELPAFYIPQGHNLTTEESGFKDAYKGFDIFGGYLFESHVKVNDLVRQLDPENSGIISRKDFKIYMRSLDLLTSSQINTFLTKVWRRKKTISNAFFGRTMHSMIIRTIKKDEINRILGRLKDYFVNKKNVITDQIFAILSKNKDSLLVSDFREALNQSGVCIPYSEFNLILNSFDIEYGKISSQNFRSVLDKVPIPRPYMRKNMIATATSPIMKDKEPKGKNRPIVFDERLKSYNGFEKSITVEEFLNQAKTTANTTRPITSMPTPMSKSLGKTPFMRESLGTGNSRRDKQSNVNRTLPAPSVLVEDDAEPNTFTAKLDMLSGGQPSGTTITNIYPDSTVKFSCNMGPETYQNTEASLQMSIQERINVPTPGGSRARSTLLPPTSEFDREPKTPRSKIQLHTLLYSLAPYQKLKTAANMLNSLKIENKSKEIMRKIRSLGCWVYQYPGLDFEKLGKIERDGIVKVTCQTGDGKWLKIQHDGIEGWILGTKADFITDRPLYDNFDKSIIPLDKHIRGQLLPPAAAPGGMAISTPSSPGGGNPISRSSKTQYGRFANSSSKIGRTAETTSAVGFYKPGSPLGHEYLGTPPISTNTIPAQTASLVNLRRFPKWASSSIRTLNIGTNVYIKAYNQGISWVQVSLQLKGKQLEGWLPYENIQHNPLKTLIPNDNTPWYKIEQPKTPKGLTFKDEVEVLNEKEKVLNYADKANLDFGFFQDIKERKLQMRFQNGPRVNPDEVDHIVSKTLSRIEEVRQHHMIELNEQVSKKRKQKLCLTILFNYSLMKSFKQWRENIKPKKPKTMRSRVPSINLTGRLSKAAYGGKMNQTVGSEMFNTLGNTPSRVHQYFLP